MKKSQPHGLKVGEKFQGRFRYDTGYWLNGIGSYLGDNKSETFMGVMSGKVRVVFGKGEWKRRNRRPVDSEDLYIYYGVQSMSEISSIIYDLTINLREKLLLLADAVLKQANEPSSDPNLSIRWKAITLFEFSLSFLCRKYPEIRKDEQFILDAFRQCCPPQRS